MVKLSPKLFENGSSRSIQANPHSILSMFRDGVVYDNEESFREFAQLPFKRLGVVAELDPVCSKSQLVNLGLDNVEIVGKADHAFVPSKHSEVARILYRF